MVDHLQSGQHDPGRLAVPPDGRADGWQDVPARALLPGDEITETSTPDGAIYTVVRLDQESGVLVVNEGVAVPVRDWDSRVLRHTAAGRRTS